jgi:hypothetical protein
MNVEIGRPKVAGGITSYLQASIQRLTLILNL